MNKKQLAKKVKIVRIIDLIFFWLSMVNVRLIEIYNKLISSKIIDVRNKYSNKVRQILRMYCTNCTRYKNDYQLCIMCKFEKKEIK